MPDRAAKFVSAIVASVLAGASLAAISLNAARAADDCLPLPNAETPAGSHWYYRIDRGTKRHCWYLRAEGETLAQTAAPNSSAPAKPVAPMADSSDAALGRGRACRTASRRRASIRPTQRWPCPGDAGQCGHGSRQQGGAPGANAPQSVVASRWLDPSAMSSTVGPQPAPSQMAANAPPGGVVQSDSPQSDPSQSDSAAAPPPAAAAVPLAAADSSQGLPASLPMLLAVMTGALALAGITASLVLKFGARRGAPPALARPPGQDLGARSDDDRPAVGSPGRRRCSAPAAFSARPRSARASRTTGLPNFTRSCRSKPELTATAISPAAAAARARTSSNRCGVRASAARP